ncbi:MAG: hypothetical protein H7287_14030 [Thermoleophilia bacterium]|nr:hypothetical protein [Thermoleophilia bacterium]
MPTDTQMTDAMHALRAELEPDAATLERMREATRAAPTTGAFARPRRRRRFIASWAMVALVATGLVAAIAVAPDNDVRVGPASARAALLEAGTAAGTQPWTPFGPDDYHHLYTMSVAPDWPDEIDEVEPQSTQNANLILGNEESWSRVDGSGIRVSWERLGNNTDPRRYVQASFSPKTGRFEGFTTPEPSSPDDLNTKRPPIADMVDVERQRAAGNRRETWLRTPLGYRKYSDQEGYVRPVTGATPDEAQQVKDWGVTAATVARLNAAEGDALDTAVEAVLGTGGDLPSRSGELQDLVPGRFGESEQSLLAESRVERATTLLARAPLAPAVRRMLFTQLAQLPGAKIDGPQKDATGRRGVGATFSRYATVDVLGHSVDLADLKAQALRVGFPRPDVDAFEPDADALTVPRHTERRWWYVHLVFDRATGQVLQVATYSRYSSDGGNPHIDWASTGPDRRLHISNLSVDGLDGSSTVFVSRDRAAPEHPTSPFCETTPVMCTDAGAREPIVTEAEDAKIRGRD